jgi:hypothetical protein
VTSNSSNQVNKTPQDEYIQGVREDIKQHRAYFSRQMTRYRAARIVVIVTAALVPVLAAVGGVPRWALGLLGAIAAITEGVQGLFQFRRSALDAMKTCNELERTLNRYLTAIDPYQGSPDTAFPLFVAEIEAIRKAADDAFLQTWQATASPQPLPDSQRAVPPAHRPEIGKS